MGKFAYVALPLELQLGMGMIVFCHHYVVTNSMVVKKTKA